MSALIEIDVAAKTNVDRLREKLVASELDALLITNLRDVRWLTNFSGSNGTLLLTHESLWLFTDGRYAEQVKNEVKFADCVITSDGYLAELKTGKYLAGNRIGFQADNLTVASFGKLKLELAFVELIAQSNFCDEFVAVKSLEELENMKRAVSITDKVFQKLLEMMSPNVTERDVAAEISYWNKKFGAEKDSFDPIVASGLHGALPHARATDNFLQNNSLVVIDMGCVVNGYCSDQTRTVALGKISDDAKRAYQIVLDAHLLGIASAKAGMTGKELDGIVREFLTEQGYGEAFSHSLGHSVGLQVHEQPIVGKKTEMTIPAGAVITIEPGVYFPNEFGVRIEDMVLVTDSGATPLPEAPKNLIEL